jgi:hypothetical protein
VRLGEYDERTDIDCDMYDICADPLQDIPVQHFIVHPDYDRETITNDIGIVRLGEAAKVIQNNITPICLPFELTARRIDKKFTVIGEC